MEKKTGKLTRETNLFKITWKFRNWKIQYRDQLTSRIDTNVSDPDDRSTEIIKTGEKKIFKK